MKFAPLTAAGVVAASLLGGCGFKWGDTTVTDEGGVRRIRREGAGKRAKRANPLVVSGDKNKFIVEDDQGNPVMHANVVKVDGMVRPGVGLEGPVKMHGAKCLLFEKGKPSMDLESDEATWDGERLVTQKPAHGVTADKKTIIDGSQATWTAENGRLDLVQAKLQAMKGGKVDFTTEGPKAHVLNNIVTMPSGSTSRNPEGQQLTADNVRWEMKTAKLDARGNVVVTQKGTRVSGERLRGNTKLQRGRMSGNVKVQLQEMPIRKKRR